MDHENSLFSAVSLPVHFRVADRLITLLMEPEVDENSIVGSQRDASINSLIIYSSFFLSGAMRRAVASESYSVPVLLRGAIECVGYAAHMIKSDEAADAWFRRHEEFAAEARAAATEERTVDLTPYFDGDESGRRASRRAFETRKWQESLAELMSEFPQGQEVVNHLEKWYAITLDLGAHPNILMTLVGSETHLGAKTDPATRVHNLFTGDSSLVAADIENVFRVGANIARVQMAIRYPPGGNKTLLDYLARLERDLAMTTQLGH